MAAAVAHPTFSIAKNSNKERLALKAGNGDYLPEIGMLKSSTADLPIEELRRRYWQDGYLWVRTG